VEYAFVITSDNVIGVCRNDDLKITEEEVRAVSDYVQAEGWTEKNAAVEGKKRRQKSTASRGRITKKEAVEFPLLRMPPPLVPCPQLKREARTTLTMILTSTLIRLQGLQGLF
jgi:hypothetical protein